MKLVKVWPLPQICKNCQEKKDVIKFGVDAVCYNCDRLLEKRKVQK